MEPQPRHDDRITDELFICGGLGDIATETRFGLASRRIRAMTPRSALIVPKTARRATLRVYSRAPPDASIGSGNCTFNLGQWANVLAIDQRFPSKATGCQSVPAELRVRTQPSGAELWPLSPRKRASATHRCASRTDPRLDRPGASLACAVAAQRIESRCGRPGGEHNTSCASPPAFSFPPPTSNGPGVRGRCAWPHHRTGLAPRSLGGLLALRVATALIAAS